MMYYVAKSYQEWERETEPYEANGKMYVVVRKPTGATKIVRAYTETEYRKMYPADVPPVSIVETAKPQGHVVKDLLGFQKGYIHIFKGDLENAEYWFKRTSVCRFHVILGWYIVSTDEIPFDIPSCIQSVQLPWEKVGNTDGTLLPKATIQAALDELRYDESPSQYQGIVGERLDLTVTLTRVIDLGENQYGSTSRIYCFIDANENCYSWTTGVSKDWIVNDSLKLRGTVKQHDIVKGVKYTMLTRVMEVKT
jgi:hypothetical protein